MLVNDINMTAGERGRCCHEHVHSAFLKDLLEPADSFSHMSPQGKGEVGAGG